MKKFSIYVAGALLMLAASCKEHVTPPSGNDSQATDSTYVSSTIEPVQTKHILIEELSGVICPNCPDGTIKLDTLSAQNPGILEIVTIHTGALTDPIEGASKQDFRTTDGQALRELVWGEQGSKPTAAFDRRPYGNQNNTYFVNVYTNWPSIITRCKTDAPTTPVNIAIKSTYISDSDRYDIEVKVAYTAAVTGQQALSIFLTESGIVDAQEYSPEDIDTFYTFNHMFRRAITAPVGRLFLTDLTVKEAGRVYIYRTSLKIDATDDKQKLWNEDHMHLVAFVTMSEPGDKHVLQVQSIDLK